MRLFHLCLCALASLGGTAIASAMNNADVIKLLKAEFSEETIIATIEKELADYDTTPGALIDLKEAGVPEPIIRTMVARSSEKPLSDQQASPESTFMSLESPSIAPAMIQPAAGKEYYTRFSFHQEGGEYPTTNYARGTAVPINTKVTLVKLRGDKMTLKIMDSGVNLTVENKKKYSGKDMAAIASLMLSEEPTPLEQLTPKLADAIRGGELRKGMTKEQVLMTRGYPPAHETPSLEGDRWIYWSSRFVKHTLVFTDDRLTDGRGIY